MADQFIQKPGGEAVTLESQGFKTLQDAANVGFAGVAAPVVESSEPIGQVEPIQVEEVEQVATPTLKADTLKTTDTSAIDKSAQMNEGLVSVKQTLKTNPTGLADIVFANQIAQAVRGRDASPEELKSVSEGGIIGGSIADVSRRFGVALDEEGLPVEAGLEFRAGITQTQKQSIIELQEKPRSEWTQEDVTNFNFATDGNETFEEPKAPEVTDVTTDTKTDVTGNTVAKTALDKQKDLVDSFLTDKQKFKEEAREKAGVAGIQESINTATEELNAIKASLDEDQADVDLQDILNTEAQLALKNKIEGRGGLMSAINREMFKEMGDLTQEQRLDRVLDIYALNTKINNFNAKVSNLKLLEGKYTQATDDVKNDILDWTQMKELELDILESEGLIEKEARAEAQAEIDFQNDLGLEGYVKIEDTNTYNKMVKDLGVTADNFSDFFFKAANGDIYKKPAPTTDLASITEQIKAREAGFEIVDGVIQPLKPVTPTGEIETITLNDRDLSLDSVTTSSLNTINEQASDLGGLVIGGVATSTIRTAEEQKALFDAGKTPLDGTNQISKHQLGLAIDLFPNQKYIADMKPIMNANGWEQTAGADDLGHFEFTGGGLERVQLDADLAQIRNGLLTKGDATDLKEKYKDNPSALKEITQAFGDPKNKSVSEAQATKLNAPANITRGQLDQIIATRQANGFGNKLFQSQKDKEYNNIVEWLEMEKDINSMRALKEGGEFIATLDQDEQDRILNEFGDDFGVTTTEELKTIKGSDTGPTKGVSLGVGEFFGGGDKRLIALDIISGKYKTAFMKEISGVAISEPEAVRLGNLVPNIKLQDTRFVQSASDAQDSLNDKLLAASNKFGFSTIDELRDSTERTRAGEFFDIDTQVLDNISQNISSPQGTGITDEEDAQLSEDEAFKAYQETISK